LIRQSITDKVARSRIVRLIGAFLDLQPKFTGASHRVFQITEELPEMGTKRTGKGRRKIGSTKRRNRAKIRHRKK
jgi:hypothetical protein